MLPLPPHKEVEMSASPHSGNQARSLRQRHEENNGQVDVVAFGPAGTNISEVTNKTHESESI